MPTFGLHPFFIEKPHPLMMDDPDTVKSYSVFSARYGNIYTVSQMLELVEQGVGCRDVIHEYALQDGRYYDLLRPNINRSGFSSIEEAHADRLYHLSRVNKLFQEADVFIFTLGLTEGWKNKSKGYTYPVCPGTAKGVFDPVQHVFTQAKHSEILLELSNLISLLRSVNPGLKVILTVSPVSLVATRLDSNVLVATEHAKSTLRSVAGEVATVFDNTDYFPSYEIISGAASFGQFLDESLRGVNSRGIDCVMQNFFRCYLDESFPHSYDSHYSDGSFPRNEKEVSIFESSSRSSSVDIAAKIVEAECDEIFNQI